MAKAIVAWRLVLTGRFRLLNHWCDFVQVKKFLLNITKRFCSQFLLKIENLQAEVSAA